MLIRHMETNLLKFSLNVQLNLILGIKETSNVFRVSEAAFGFFFCFLIWSWIFLRVIVFYSHRADLLLKLNSIEFFINFCRA